MAHQSAREKRALRAARIARLRARGRSVFDSRQPLARNPSITALQFRGQAAVQTARAQLLKPPEIKMGVLATPGRAVAVRLAARVIGTPRAQQLGNIVRQQAARVPLVAKVAGLGGAATAASLALESATGRSPARFVFDATRGVFGGSGTQPRATAPRRRDMPGRQLAVGSELPPSHMVVRVWQTFPGGPVFAKLADGHIAVQKKDGTIKHFRPYRPVVIPKKWNARSMSRVVTALKRQRKTATKLLQITGGLPGKRGK